MEKISKAINQLFDEEIKKNIKTIKTAKAVELSHYNKHAQLKNEAGEFISYLTVSLTEKQLQKPLKDIKEILIKKTTKQAETRRADYLEKLAKIEQATVPTYLRIVVDWTRSKTWGFCPQAELVTGLGYYTSNRITGCGYDKESTATASVLNQEHGIIKAILQKISKHSIKDIKEILKGNKGRAGFPYGLGFYYLPYFEGGVGTSCHLRILEELGYKTTAEHTGRTENYYSLELKGAKNV